MIVDGRIPSPQQAREAHRRRREQRRQQPAEQRRAAERKQRREAESGARSAKYATQRAEDAEQPLWETLHEIFDFSDPDLWKSNSFASLRPRLIVHLEASIAALRAEQLSWVNRLATRWRDERQLALIEPRLVGAREALDILRATAGGDGA